MNFTILKNADFTITIYIENIAGADSYNIYSSTNPFEDGYSLLDNSVSTTYTSSVLTEGYVYYIRISSVTGGVESQPTANQYVYITGNTNDGLWKVCELLKSELTALYDTKKIIISKEMPQEILKDYIIWIQPADGETDEPLANFMRLASYPITIYVLRGVIGLSESKSIQTLITDNENIMDLLRDNTLSGYANSAEVTDITGPSSVEQPDGNVSVMGIKLNTLWKRRIRRATAANLSIYNNGCVWG